MPMMNSDRDGAFPLITCRRSSAMAAYYPLADNKLTHYLSAPAEFEYR